MVMSKAPLKCRSSCLRLTRRLAASLLTASTIRRPVYAAVEAHSLGAQVIIPPRQGVVPSRTSATSPTQCDQHLAVIEHEGVFAWKRTLGYYAQSHAENAFARYKRRFGDGLRAKREVSQQRETMLACGLLNRMRQMGRPQSYLVR